MKATIDCIGEQFLTHNICDRDDRPIISRRVGTFFFYLFRRHYRSVIRAFINRAKERGFINSFAYHELHAMANRVCE